MSEMESRLAAVALDGLDAVQEFLQGRITPSAELFRKSHLRAKIGSNAVSNYVRHLSAVNMREALALQAGRVTLPAPRTKALKAG